MHVDMKICFEYLYYFIVGIFIDDKPEVLIKIRANLGFYIKLKYKYIFYSVLYNS